MHDDVDAFVTWISTSRVWKWGGGGLSLIGYWPMLVEISRAFRAAW